MTGIDRLTAALADRYRIEGELGEGGMATVYLAHDLKHDRKVALKVLRPELAAVIGGERFLAEIKTTANLQHPHILPLFDSGEVAGTVFYVMPFVEGESLRDRLNRVKQLPVDEAVRIAREVADALEHAHGHGIIHRDIKPENILLYGGHALVADFGIALAVSRSEGGTRMTETGMSLGTPHYMSPEQAMGEKNITPAADVYALGCVLYEMLTGEPPFDGPTAQAVVARLLTSEPEPVTTLRKTVPEHVEIALEKALEKLPADRFASAAEFGAALADTAAVRAAGSRAATRSSASSISPRVLSGAGAVVVLALVLGWFLRGWLDRSPPAAPVRFAFDLAHPGVEQGYVAISPDGRRIAMSVMDSNGVLHIGERELGSTAVRIIAGTEGGNSPSYSPDGKWISFNEEGRHTLVKVPAQGGTATAVSDSTQGFAATWLPDGSLVAPGAAGNGLIEIPASGGGPVHLTQLDTARHEFAHWSPRVLPDGHTVIYNAYASPVTQSRIEAFDLKTHKRTVLVENAVFPRYASDGYLLFARNQAIFAVRFDAASLKVSGTPVPVQGDVAWRATDGFAGYDVSSNGTLVYLSAAAWNVPREVVWMDRAGNATRALPDTGSWAEPRISPDGRFISVSVLQPKSAIYVYDIARRVLSPVTHAAGIAFNGIWTPDSRHLVYSYEDPVYDLHVTSIDGSTPDRALVNSPYDKYATSVSPDGKWVAYTDQPGGSQIMVTALGDTATPHPLFSDSRSSRRGAVFSPDGRWVAYEETNDGRSDVYVRAADGSGGRHPVSADGGTEPRWTRGGREIVYRRGTAIMAVPVDLATGEIGTPALLFRAPVLQRQGSRAASYDVTPDGNRFLILRPVERSGAPATVVVLHWFTDLEETMKQ